MTCYLYLSVAVTELLVMKTGQQTLDRKGLHFESAWEHLIKIKQ